MTELKNEFNSLKNEYWYNQIQDEDLKNAAILNWQNNGAYEGNEARLSNEELSAGDSVSTALNNGFTFYDSPEGQNFWDDVCHQFELGVYKVIEPTKNEQDEQ